MIDLVLFGIYIPAWLYAPVIFLVWVSLLLILKRVFLSWIERISAKTHNHLDDIFIDALRFPLTLIIYVSGAAVLQKFAISDQKTGMAVFFTFVFKAALIVAIILFVDRLIQNLLKRYSPRISALKDMGGIVQGFIRVVVIGLGFLILLDTLGLSITPILASLGIGSLAVALALQPTLENFFAGIQVVADRLIKVGEYVKIDSGEEGRVDCIGWRSTWIKTPTNNIVIIPNKILMNARVINWDLPDPQITVPVQVRVGYDSDLAKVEKVTVEIAEEVMKTTPGAVPGAKPGFVFEAFGQTGIEMTVVLRVFDVTNQGPVRHQFIKKLFERYKKEGISIARPYLVPKEEAEGVKP